MPRGPGPARASCVRWASGPEGPCSSGDPGPTRRSLPRLAAMGSALLRPGGVRRRQGTGILPSLIRSLSQPSVPAGDLPQPATSRKAPPHPAFRGAGRARCSRPPSVRAPREAGQRLRQGAVAPPPEEE